MIPNRNGIFQGKLVERAVGESNNGLVRFIGKMKITEELSNGETFDIAADDLEITGYFPIEKKDGKLNVNTVANIKESLGWDGRDVMALQNDPKFGDIPVQFVCAMETYEGKESLKVQYINPYGSTNSGAVVAKADDAMAKKIAGKLGPQLRALAGPTATPGKPATPPAAHTPVTRVPPAGSPAPAGRPAAARPVAAAPSAPALAAVPPATLESAWAAFTTKTDPSWDQKATEDEWFRVLEIMFPGKPTTTYTAADWAKVRDEGPAQIAPF